MKRERVISHFSLATETTKGQPLYNAVPKHVRRIGYTLSQKVSGHKFRTVNTGLFKQINRLMPNDQLDVHYNTFPVS